MQYFKAQTNLFLKNVLVHCVLLMVTKSSDILCSNKSRHCSASSVKIRGAKFRISGYYPVISINPFNVV